ncbi:Transmembrane protein [Orchesella cincta]|uniref:Transmembrane protein 267 n=1 Tax=Orchesella cincta TaxID=48709 RepID=A0A1D2MQH5_ORCCI|nr:Transmembrane protein [Orchesella cincta]
MLFTFGNRLDPVHIFGTVALLLYTDFGDYLESTNVALSCPRFRAVLDNMIHVHIGILTWSILDPVPWSLNMDMLTVALGASLIDVDHFIAAGSWSIDNAIHASHRGIFHSTGLFFLIFFILHRFKPHLALLFLVAFLPHHMRDAQRRGIYIFPPASLGLETPPVPKFIVRLFLPIFPWLLVGLRERFNIGLDFPPVLPKVWNA